MLLKYRIFAQSLIGRIICDRQRFLFIELCVHIRPVRIKPAEKCR